MEAEQRGEANQMLQFGGGDTADRALESHLTLRAPVPQEPLGTMPVSLQERTW